MLIVNGIGGVFLKKAVVFVSKLVYLFIMFTVGAFMSNPTGMDYVYGAVVMLCKTTFDYIRNFLTFCVNYLINVL